MSFRGDERAVSTVVGAVLIFAVLILALGVYQAQIVPAQNERVEYEHSQSVGNQLQDLRNALVGTAATGNERPGSVTLGVRYPSRTFTVNPPPPTGTLRGMAFENRTNITISNVRATNDETAHYLDGTLNVSTDGLEYVPDYNEFRNAPTTRYEHGTLYDAYENADISRTGGVVIDDGVITLVTLNVSEGFRETGVDSVSIDPQALSAPYRTTTVKNEGGPLTITLPTNGNESMWQEVYEDSDAATVSPNGSAVDITLDNGTYDLRMASVGVGSGLSGPNAEYITLVRGNGTDRVTVEVRDRYNNPVSDVEVSAAGGSFEENETESGADGRATFVYTGDSNRNATFSIDGGERQHEVTATVTPSDGGPDEPGGPDGPFDVFWNATASNASDVTCYPGTDGTDTCYAVGQRVNLTAGTSPLEDGAPLEFQTNRSEIDGADVWADSGGKGIFDLNATAIDTTENRWVAAYVSSVGSGDRTRVFLNNRPTAAFDSPTVAATNETIEFNASTSSDPDDDALIYEWKFENGSTGAGETANHTYSSEGTYTVTLTVTDEYGLTDSTTREVTISDGPIDDTPPTLERFIVTDESRGSGQAEFDTNWTVSDAESGLSSVTISLIDADGGIVDSVNSTVSGASASGTDTLAGSGGGSGGEEYTIEIEVTDNAGNVEIGSVTDTADGDGGGGAGQDPGFAFNDVDGDGAYNSSTDNAIPDIEQEISDNGGSLSRSDDLVIPESVGDISIQDMAVTLSGEGLQIRTSVSGSNGLTLEARTGTIRASNSDLSAQNGPTELVAPGDIYIRNATVTSPQQVQVNSLNGAVYGDRVTVEASNNAPTKVTSQSDVHLNNSIVSGPGANVTARQGTLYAINATLESTNGDLTVGAGEDAYLGDSSTTASTSVSINVDGTLYGNRTTIQSGSDMSVETGGDTYFNSVDADITNAGGITLDIGGVAYANDSSYSATQPTSVTTADTAYLNNISWTVSGGSVTFDLGGTGYANRSMFDTQNSRIDWTTAGRTYTNDAVFDTSNGEIAFDIGNTFYLNRSELRTSNYNNVVAALSSGPLYVADLSVEDGDNALGYTPSSVRVVPEDSTAVTPQ